MNVLITGASGFIGKALCKKMLRNGWQVRGAIRFENLMCNLPDGVQPVFIGSIGPNTEWRKATSNIDVVVHLAAQVHKTRNVPKDPLSEYRRVNVYGTKVLARAAADNGIKRFVYLSTVKVNGEGRTTSYTEKDKPEPIDPYAVSKWESENVLHVISCETDLEVVIIRSPLVYGPYVKANFLRLLKMIDYGIPLPLASVQNRRSLIYLENLLDAIITCIKHPRVTGQTYFVSDGKDVSTPELIRLISKYMGKNSRLFPFSPSMLKTIGKIAGRSAEINRLIGSLCVECSKIRRMLGWNAPYTPEEGIRKTVLWYKKYGKGQRTDVRW